MSKPFHAALTYAPTVRTLSLPQCDQSLDSGNSDEGPSRFNDIYSPVTTGENTAMWGSLIGKTLSVKVHSTIGR